MADPKQAWGPVSALMNSAKYEADYLDTLIESLSSVIRDGLWMCFQRPNGDVQEYADSQFSSFLSVPPTAGAGIKRDDLLAVLRARGEDELAARVLELTTGALTEHGTNGGVCGTNSEQQDAGYVVARLKRDDPALAQAVIDGDLSPNAAAVRAGIRHAYARIRTDDPRRAVTVLLKHYTREQILAALEAP